MNEKIGRNDPCPCGSGKKYKSCCLLKQTQPVKRKITATWLSAPKQVNLMERTFGQALAQNNDKPPAPPEEEEKNKNDSTINPEGK